MMLRLPSQKIPACCDDSKPVESLTWIIDPIIIVCAIDGCNDDLTPGKEECEVRIFLEPPLFGIDEDKEADNYLCKIMFPTEKESARLVGFIMGESRRGKADPSRIAAVKIIEEQNPPVGKLKYEVRVYLNAPSSYGTEDNYCCSKAFSMSSEVEKYIDALFGKSQLKWEEIIWGQES